MTLCQGYCLAWTQTKKNQKIYFKPHNQICIINCPVKVLLSLILVAKWPKVLGYILGTTNSYSEEFWSSCSILLGPHFINLWDVRNFVNSYKIINWKLNKSINCWTYYLMLCLICNHIQRSELIILSSGCPRRMALNICSLYLQGVHKNRS